MQVAVGMSNEGVSNEGVCGRLEQIRERSGDVDRSLEGGKWCPGSQVVWTPGTTSSVARVGACSGG